MLAISKIHELFLSCHGGVTIDSRKVAHNSFFVAIKGEKYDAHHFIEDVINQGASYVLIDNSDYEHIKNTILVENSISTLQELASFHRNYMKTTVISLTGSNGKTTCKELINEVLSAKYKTIATVGNLNNHLGVPLTLLSIKKEHEIAIVEMGANHQKEIEFLCQIAKPDFGLITNFGKAHLEGFGGIDGVIQGKSEMYDYLKINQKIAFVNVMDPLQVIQSKGLTSFTFGLNSDKAMVNFDLMNTDAFASLSYKNHLIQSNLIGQYNINNLMLASAVGLYFEVDILLIKEAIENYFPNNNRSQLVAFSSNQVIMDAYNANPSSMEAAIYHFVSMDALQKTIILGDMFELGEESLEEHQAILNLLLNENQIQVFLIGNWFNQCHHQTSHIHQYKTFEDFVLFLENHSIENNLILIKGSRGMALERVLDFLKK
jgi:UDP-N-acetylmuramoyl-tripeptide--D-alanyl-D-alanine ligase